ncbi:hypothetical protein GSI_11748 [Ganoderma sinense ZZ0214-1]|uniref:Uncharacterized protein n=1 Tax=Ganoderma sinense ZZ0214-1 TaxID=1077348 RepID=A0A2G8RWY4_9APHY|nr:hypothetical protein GSI_11748 [Ganoderma sinense ZZ0214-1]
MKLAMRMKRPAGPAIPQLTPPFEAPFLEEVGAWEPPVPLGVEAAPLEGTAPTPLSGICTGTKVAIEVYVAWATLVVVVPSMTPTTIPDAEQEAATAPPLAGVARAHPSEARMLRVAPPTTVFVDPISCTSVDPATRVTVWYG